MTNSQTSNSPLFFADLAKNWQYSVLGSLRDALLSGPRSACIFRMFTRYYEINQNDQKKQGEKKQTFRHNPTVQQEKLMNSSKQDENLNVHWELAQFHNSRRFQVIPFPGYNKLWMKNFMSATCEVQMLTSQSLSPPTKFAVPLLEEDSPTAKRSHQTLSSLLLEGHQPELNRTQARTLIRNGTVPFVLSELRVFTAEAAT